jgi:transcription antitermination factor NusG
MKEIRTIRKEDLFFSSTATTVNIRVTENKVNDIRWKCLKKLVKEDKINCNYNAEMCTFFLELKNTWRHKEKLNYVRMNFKLEKDILGEYILVTVDYSFTINGEERYMSYDNINKIFSSIKSSLLYSSYTFEKIANELELIGIKVDSSVLDSDDYVLTLKPKKQKN